MVFNMLFYGRLDHFSRAVAQFRHQTVELLGFMLRPRRVHGINVHYALHRIQVSECASFKNKAAVNIHFVPSLRDIQLVSPSAGRLCHESPPAQLSLRFECRLSDGVTSAARLQNRT